MADRWGPFETNRIGFDLRPERRRSVLLDSASACLCQSIAQTAAGTVTALTLLFDAVQNTTGVYSVEAFDNEDAVITGLASGIAAPNEDVSGTGAAAWKNQAGGTSNIYQAIDELLSAQDLTDYITSANAATTYVGRFGTSTTYNGLRTLSVTLRAVVFATGTWTLGINIAGVNYPLVSGNALAGATVITKTLLYNPATSRPWLAADIAALDTTGGWFITNTTGQTVVYRVDLPIAYCTENRQAVGGRTITTVSGAGTSFTVVTPTGGSWAKDTTGRTTYVVRRLSDTGSVSAGVVDMEEGSSAPVRSFEPTLDPATGAALEMGDSTPSMFTLVPNAGSIDGQGYGTFDPNYGAVQSTGVGAQHIEQEWSRAAAGDYKLLTFYLLRFTNAIGVVGAGTAGADLTIKVKRRSDNVQMGSTITITNAEVLAAEAIGTVEPSPVAPWPLEILKFERTLTVAATLAASVQYYLEFVTTDAVHEYIVLVAVGIDSGAAGYGATTDVLTLTGIGDFTNADVVATLATIPNPPRNLTATKVDQPVAA